MYVDSSNRYYLSISQAVIHRPLVVHGVLLDGLEGNFNSKALLLFEQLCRNTVKYLGVVLSVLVFFFMKCLTVANTNFKTCMRELN